MPKRLEYSLKRRKIKYVSYKHRQQFVPHLDSTQYLIRRDELKVEMRNRFVFILYSE